MLENTDHMHSKIDFILLIKMKKMNMTHAFALFPYVILIGISYKLQHSESTMHIKRHQSYPNMQHYRYMYQPMVEKIPTVLGPLIQRN